MTPIKKAGLNEENEPVAKNELDLETRRRILEAAHELFVTKGFKGVSMRDVAEAVKVTPAALYYYFPQGKEDLFVEVIRHMFTKQAEGLREATKLGENTREKLRLLAMHLLMRAQGMRSGPPLLMRDVHEYLDKARQPEIWQHYRQTYFNSVREIFQEGVDQGEISSVISLDVLTSMFHGMVFSFGMRPQDREWMQDLVEAGRAADTLLTVLFDGIGIKY
jgi:AcrR family transcriptional regulator